jgi:anti-anti-sigma factor
MASRSNAPAYRVTIDGDRAIVHIPGNQFGSLAGESADRALLQLVDGIVQSQVALNFHQVDFLNSLGLTLLLTLHKRLVASGRRFAVLNLQPQVYEVLDVTRLNSVLDVGQQEAALQPSK